MAGKAETFLKILLSVKLEIFRLDLITGDTRDLTLCSCSHTYPGEEVITVTDINNNSPQLPNSVTQNSFFEGSAPSTRAILDTGSNGLWSTGYSSATRRRSPTFTRRSQKAVHDERDRPH